MKFILHRRGAETPRKALLLILIAAPCFAQDLRTVTEPVVPASCYVLEAKLASVDGGRTLSDADEAKSDTVRIQKALDACPQGQAVELRANAGHDAFLSGPLDLRAGVTLVVGKGTILFGSRNPRDYDVRPGSCGIVDQKGHGCRAVLNGEGVAGAGVMGPGTIDGRGWAKILGGNASWWELAEQARKGGYQNCPRLIVLDRSNSFTLYQVTLKNSGNFHVYYGNGDGFTAWGVIINTPKNARNTDGIDPSGSRNVTITHCFLHTGDDQVAIKAGGHVSHMTIAHNHFYTGHGMSIGSETYGGADSIRVIDLSIDGADNGIRIKSNAGRGGLVRDIQYRDVCIRDTKNPIFMDSDYEHFGPNGNRLPQFTGISLANVRIEGAGKITLQGFDEQHRLGMKFDNVQADDPGALKIVAAHAVLDFGPGAVNFRPQGDDVAIHGTPEGGVPVSCSERFVPMPIPPAPPRR